MKTLVQLMRSINSTLDELLVIEQEKIKVLESGRITFLEDCIKKEQVVTLKIRGLEQERKKILSSMGVSDSATLSDLMPDLPEDEVSQLRPLLETVQQKTAEFQKMNEAASDFIQIQLHKATKRMDEIQTYNQAGKEKNNAGSFRARKV